VDSYLRKNTHIVTGTQLLPANCPAYFQVPVSSAERHFTMGDDGRLPSKSGTMAKAKLNMPLILFPSLISMQ
jgi:hypothetical protein